MGRLFSGFSIRFDFIGDKLIIGKFCQIDTGVCFIMNGSNHAINGFATYPFKIYGREWGNALLDRQRKGYGTDMMVFLMKIAKDCGCHSVTLSASSNEGYGIYERLGFPTVGEFECFEYKEDRTRTSDC